MPLHFQLLLGCIFINLVAALTSVCLNVIIKLQKSGHSVPNIAFSNESLNALFSLTGTKNYSIKKYLVFYYNRYLNDHFGTPSQLGIKRLKCDLICLDEYKN